MTTFELAIKKDKFKSGSAFISLLKSSNLSGCFMSSFKTLGLLVMKKKIFKGFHHKWTCWQSWSCDLNHLCKLSLNLAMIGPADLAIFDGGHRQQPPEDVFNL